jgi:hypothetical protein
MQTRFIGDARYGCSAHYDLAKKICCHNTEFAENSGFFQTGILRSTAVAIDPRPFMRATVSCRLHAVGLFDKLEAQDGKATFYDSAETTEHVWPSFRAAEAITANINCIDTSMLSSHVPNQMSSVLIPVC